MKSKRRIRGLSVPAREFWGIFRLKGIGTLSILGGVLDSSHRVPLALRFLRSWHRNSASCRLRQTREGHLDQLGHQRAM